MKKCRIESNLNKMSPIQYRTLYYKNQLKICLKFLV